jgi:HD-GYP domain-containing protein (c-di-GMP phosphodiesterase class II)
MLRAGREDSGTQRIEEKRNEMSRVKLSDIRVGEPLPFDCYDESGVLLLRRGVTIASERQLEGLIERGLYSEGGASGAPRRPAEPAAPAEKPSVFSQLAMVEAQLTKLFKGVLDKHPDANFAERVMDLARHIQAICAADADATLGALHLDNKGLYTVIHPIDVAVLCEIMAIRKGLPPAERLSLLAAALTANIAILDLQEALHRQTDPLTDAQREVIRMHPVLGVDMLLDLGVQDDAWFTAVLHHHEKIDGSGYPGAMGGDYIPMSARILSLADTYSAMVTPRAFREAVSAQQALRELFLKRGAEVDAELAQLFIKELGVYPPGAFVKLSSGDVGVVIKRGKDGTSPIVKCVIGPRGAPLPFPVRRDTGQKGFEIRQMVPRDKSLRMDLRLLWA